MTSASNHMKHSMKPSDNLPVDLARMDDWAISYGAYSLSTVEGLKGG